MQQAAVKEGHPIHSRECQPPFGCQRAPKQLIRHQRWATHKTAAAVKASAKFAAAAAAIAAIVGGNTAAYAVAPVLGCWRGSGGAGREVADGGYDGVADAAYSFVVGVEMDLVAWKSGGRGNGGKEERGGLW